MDRKGVIETDKADKASTFHSRKTLEAAINDYFAEYLSESGEVADIESLADYLGTTRDELMAMMNGKRFGQILRIARNRIAKIKKQLAFSGRINATVLAFDLKNNHGYRDKPDDAEGAQSSVVFKGKASDWAQ